MNIVIIGSTKGLGASVFELFLKQPSVQKLLLVARSKEILSFQQALGVKAGKEVEILPLDLSQPEKVESALKIWETEKIDCLFYNAGILFNQDLLKQSWQEIQTTFNVNTFSFIATWKALSKAVISCNGQVLVSSSMGGYQGSVKFPGLAAYSASKAAISNLIEVLAEEHKEEGVLFNSLSFGSIQTEMLSKAFPDYQSETQPQDMAKFVVNFITGPRLFNGKNIPVSITTP